MEGLFVIIGMLAYAIVGILLSLRIISGKKAGQKAYAAVFIILLLFAYIVYEKLVEFKLWLISWPFWSKITIPAMLLSLIVIIKTIMIVKKHRLKEQGIKNE